MEARTRSQCHNTKLSCSHNFYATNVVSRYHHTRQLNYAAFVFTFTHIRVVLVENSVSTNSLLANIQDVTEPIITPFSKGCR